jgi:undecaprenyl-diphosphatase
MMTSRRQFLKAASAAALVPMPAIAQGAGPKVVVIGGGFAGATAARFIRQANPQINVTLVEAAPTFTACPFSNGVIAGLLLAAWGGALLLYTLTKYFVHRPRPPADIWLSNVGKSTSFPSGHATQSLSTYAALALVSAAVVSAARRPALAIAAVIAAGVGCSRVYLGVHWATDVLAGWLAAACWVALVARLAHTRQT